MTRINLVPPEELMDQHLFAEFREIKMVPKSLARSIAARGVEGVLKRIPPAFTLHAEHWSRELLLRQGCLLGGAVCAAEGGTRATRYQLQP